MPMETFIRSIPCTQEHVIIWCLVWQIFAVVELMRTERRFLFDKWYAVWNGFENPDGLSNLE